MRICICTFLLARYSEGSCQVKLNLEPSRKNSVGFVDSFDQRIDPQSSESFISCYQRCIGFFVRETILNKRYIFTTSGDTRCKNIMLGIFLRQQYCSLRAGNFLIVFIRTLQAALAFSFLVLHRVSL